jgi:hypothetical protein
MRPLMVYDSIAWACPSGKHIHRLQIQNRVLKEVIDALWIVRNNYYRECNLEPIREHLNEISRNLLEPIVTTT